MLRAERGVLEPDPAGVGQVLERGQDAGDVDRAGARLVPARSVGDLHVPDAVGAAPDHLDRVLAVDRQVVDVAEEPGAQADPVEDAQRVGGRADRVALVAAERLDDDDAGGPDRCHGEPQVLGGELVLAPRVAAVAVAVQDVQRRAVQRLQQSGGDVEVVAELRLPAGQRGDPALTGREVAAVGVEADQLHAGVADGSDEAVDLAVGRDRVRERPPALDGREPGVPRRLRAPQQRQLGQQDGDVDVVPQAHRPRVPRWCPSTREEQAWARSPS